MAGSHDDLAVFLGLSMEQHLLERVFLDRLLLRLVEDQKARMVTRRFCPYFHQSQQVGPMEADEVARRYVGLEIDAFDLRLVIVQRDVDLLNIETAHLVSRQLVVE